MTDYEQGLDSILIDSIEIPKMDVLFEAPDVVPSLVSSGFPYSVRTISDTSKL